MQEKFFEPECQGSTFNELWANCDLEVLPGNMSLLTDFWDIFEGNIFRIGFTRRVPTKPLREFLDFPRIKLCFSVECCGNLFWIFRNLFSW